MEIPHADADWRSSISHHKFLPSSLTGMEWAKTSQTVLTENFACLVRWRLRRCDIAGCFLLFLLLSGRWCLVFAFFCHCWPPWDLRALALSSLFPLTSGCLAFALFQIGLTLASFLLGGLFNPSYSGVFAVCRSSATFLDKFSRPPHWFLLWFGWDKQRRWWTWLNGACVGDIRDKMKGEKNALWYILSLN